MSSASNCDTCQRALGASKVVKAHGKTYHSECFACHWCRSPLVIETYYTIDGQNVCQGCRNKERCTKCGFLITETKYVVVDGKTWHEDCFRCIKCLSVLIKFHFKGNDLYCTDCLAKAEMGSGNCAGCDLELDGSVIKALGKRYHEDCFVCTKCFGPFEDDAFVNIGGNPYCDNCAKNPESLSKGLAGASIGGSSSAAGAGGSGSGSGAGGYGSGSGAGGAGGYGSGAGGAGAGGAGGYGSGAGAGGAGGAGGYGSGAGGYGSGAGAGGYGAGAGGAGGAGGSGAGAGGYGSGAGGASGYSAPREAPVPTPAPAPVYVPAPAPAYVAMPIPAPTPIQVPATLHATPLPALKQAPPEEDYEVIQVEENPHLNPANLPPRGDSKYSLQKKRFTTKMESDKPRQRDYKSKAALGFDGEASHLRDLESLQYKTIRKKD